VRLDKELKKFEIIWDDYNDEEIMSIIKFIPVEIEMELLIKYQKSFKKELSGCKLSVDSKLLEKKTPKVIFKRIKHHDEQLKKWIEKEISKILDYINDKIFDDNTVLFSKKQQEYIDLNFESVLDLLLNFLSVEYLKLYFHFIDYEISSDQQRIIDQFVLKKEIKKELEERLKADLVKEFDEKFDEVKEEIMFLKKEKSQKFESIKDELSEERQERNRAIESIENNTNDLGNQISNIKEVVEILERDIAQYQNTIEEHQEIIDVLKIKLQEQDKLILELNGEKQSNKTWEEQFIELDNKFEAQIKTLKMSIEALQNLPVRDPVNSIAISNDKEQAVYIKRGTKTTKSEPIKEIYDFHDCLADNYEKIGVKEDNSYNLAYYTAGILETNLIPLIIGFRSRDIATAITAAYVSDNPAILRMPSGYTDSHNLIKLFNSIDSHSVLIEDVIGTGSENTLVSLLKNYASDENKNKLLLLSTEDEEVLKFVPRYILNYCAIIKPEHINLTKPDFKYSDARHLFMESKLEDKVIRKYKKKIEKLIEDIHFASHYDFVKGTLFANIEKFKYQNSEKEIDKHLNKQIFPDLFLREIKLFCSEGELEVIETNLNAINE